MEKPTHDEYWQLVSPLVADANREKSMRVQHEFGRLAALL